MKIATLSGQTTYQQRFETPAQKIVVVATGALMNDVFNTNVTITMMDRNGQLKTITPKTNLGDLMEIAASNEGFVHITKGASDYTIRGTIELSNFGAIDIQGGYFQIQLDNTVSTTSWNLYALETDDLTNVIIRYSPIWCAANQYKELQTGDSYAVCLPVAKIDELHLNYKNGRTAIFTVDELKAIAMETNELAQFRYNFTANVGEVTVGYNNYLCIGLSDVVSARVRCNAEATVYLVDDEQL